ncbi:MAG: phosphate/phosphite/phosphonate ABC transporter substrate-binding protein [Halobacteriales archaeon]|nr:phosphate/phosphite/phosphonate ABC transporter substrate-binding protein [Halobacteriales archaeon]
MIGRRQYLKSAGATGAALLTAGCIGQFGDQPYNNGEVNFLMSPTEPQDLMTSQYAPVGDQLESATGQPVDLRYSRSYSTILQALGSGNGDIAETGPFAAALGVKADKIEIALQRHAFGSWTYHSVIVTREDTDIESVEDLAGKKIAFADITSASGSLYPLFMIKDAGLNIGEAPGSSEGADFEGSWSSHAQAAEALKAGQVDAAGVGRFIVWDYGADDYQEGIREVDRESGIPRAPMIVSPTLDDEEKTTLIDAMKNAPDSMYLGADGEADTDDDLWFDGVRPADLSTYQPVVDVANTLGLSTDLLDQGTA